MKIYSYCEVRQDLSAVLKEAESRGKVLIRRKDGSTFILSPDKTVSNFFDDTTIE